MVAPETEPDAEPEPEPEEDEEFGLEDFDLSEFDDLPGYDEDEAPDDEGTRTSGADDEKPKNNPQE